MGRVSILKRAVRDLEGIVDYIAEHNASAADGLKRRLRDTFELLADQPLMGESREDLGRNTRIFTVGNYAVLYRATRQGITVRQVVHSARDVDAIRRPRR